MNIIVTSKGCVCIYYMINNSNWLTQLGYSGNYNVLVCIACDVLLFCVMVNMFRETCPSERVQRKCFGLVSGRVLKTFPLQSTSWCALKTCLRCSGMFWEYILGSWFDFRTLYFGTHSKTPFFLLWLWFWHSAESTGLNMSQNIALAHEDSTKTSNTHEGKIEGTRNIACRPASLVLSIAR